MTRRGLTIPLLGVGLLLVGNGLIGPWKNVVESGPRNIDNGILTESTPVYMNRMVIYSTGSLRNASSVIAANVSSAALTSNLPSPRRVAIQTIAIGKAYPTLDNHLSYCAHWRLDYVLVDQKMMGYEIRHTVWQKIPATLALFDKNYDYVMWIDQDAIFANCSQSIDPLLDQMDQEGTSWLFSGDTLIINAGQMIFKNTKHSYEILKGIDALWYPNFDKEVKLRENGAIAAYLIGGREPNGEALQRAYDKADQCHITGNQSLCWAIQQGHPSAFQDIGVDMKLLPHITFVPQLAINAYMKNVIQVQQQAKDQNVQQSQLHNNIFIFHCAGEADKDACIQQFLVITNQISLVCKT